MIARVFQFDLRPGSLGDAVATMNAEIVPALGKIDGMSHCIVTHTSDDDSCMTTVIYRDQAAAEAAQEATQRIWGAIGPYLAGPPTLAVKDVLLAHSK